MNYLEWSQEYYDTAEQLDEVIRRLKTERKSSSLSQKKELDAKIAQFKIYYGECIQTANLLKQRHSDAA